MSDSTTFIAEPPAGIHADGRPGGPAPTRGRGRAARRPPRRGSRLLTATIGCVLLAGCTNGSFPHPRDALPAGGVTGRAGDIVLADVYVQGPSGIPRGGTAPLRLGLDDQSTVPDELLQVSTPATGRVALLDGGRPVRAIALPAGRLVDLEFRTGIVLDGLRRPLAPGAWLPVTFRFAHAGVTTLWVTVGPAPGEKG